MIIWVWILIASTVLVVGVLAGFWQHLFNQTQPTPWQIDPGGHWLPTAHAMSWYEFNHGGFPTNNKMSDESNC
jgi:hypothetical protein